MMAAGDDNDHPMSLADSSSPVEPALHDDNDDPPRPSASHHGVAAWPKLFQDAITVRIPINVTADLGVAMQRTRTKRTEAIYQAFPMLRNVNEQTTKTTGAADESARNSPAASDADDDDAPSDGPAKPAKEKRDNDAATAMKRKPLKHVPHPSQFGTVLDYLEAKYVRGVVLPDDDDEEEEEGQGDKEEDDDDDDRSVYSENSFFDDTDLKRDVAEQVLAKTTHTKLELEQEDGDFFVNVGNLEVEDNEFNQYDPLEDEETNNKTSTNSKKSSSGASNDAKGAAAKGTKKRKRNVAEGGAKSTTTTSTAATAKTGKGTSGAASGPTKKAKTASEAVKREDAAQTKTTKKKAAAAKADEPKEVKKPKKEKKVPEIKKEPVKIVHRSDEDDEDNSDDDNSEDDKEDVPRPETSKTREDQENPELIAKAQQAKLEKDALLKQVVKAIHAMTEQELPRKKKKKNKIKVALTCPLGKKPGETITFSNPHIPGQKLKVQVPKDTLPGGTFRVTVPVPEDPNDPDDEEGDNNKFSRDMQEMLDNVCRVYDDWCDAQGLIQPDFAVHAEKRRKFDLLAKEFPDHLVTPVDATYLKKVVRRARQNRQKRSKTAAARQQQILFAGGGGSVSSSGNKDIMERDDAMMMDDADDSPPQPKQQQQPRASAKASQPIEQDEVPDLWTVSTKLVTPSPGLGVVFPRQVFDMAAFAEK